MNKESNIVDLHGSRAKDAPSRAISAVAEALQRKTLAFLTPRFARVLDDLDDRLFELADEASTAKEQQLYFDAMHEVRVRRQEMEGRFEETLADAFAGMMAAMAESALERGEAKLKVLESDALEELVALEGISKKVERRFLQEIWVLCTAWQHCTKGTTVAARDLPMGPSHITKALGEAVGGIRLDIKAKLVLLKLFERDLLASYGDLYAEITPVLEAHGLPSEAKSGRNEAPAKGTPGPVNRAPDRQATDLANKLFDTLEGLLGNGEDADAHAPDSLVLSKPSLMVALQDMQNEQYSQLNVPRNGKQSEQVDSELIRQLVSRLDQVSKVSSDDASALSVQRDRDTIQFVGSLFQYILEGDGLSDELKEMVARLQIPILKMAMLDKNFFSHDEHPARKLLSSLMGAGIGWQPSGEVEKDPLFKKVEQVVQRVLRDFGVDTQIFVDVYEDFQAFHDKDRRRSELLAKRTVAAADGRATAEQARGYIAGYLDQKLAQRKYPPIVGTILRDGWSKVLFLSHVQFGRDSEQFSRDVQVVERLLWSVDPVAAPTERSELIEVLPNLVESMREGFNRASLSAFETSQWFEQLERLHLAKLSRPANYADRRSKNSPAEEDSYADSVATGPDLEALDAGLAGGLGEMPVTFDTLSELESDVQSEAPLAAETNSELSFNTELDLLEAETAFLSEEEQAAEQLGVEAELPSDEDVQSQIAALRVGNWVDFREDDGKMLRCRLAAVINGIGKYIFVNRAGIKVAEFNREELGNAIRHQQLFLIEDGRLFDRALESVISNLREMKDKPQS